MTSQNSVSVIVPCYNAEKTIEQTLYSVYRQSHRPTEVIVVDDGSTDSSAQVVKRVSKAMGDFLKVRLVLQQNRGVSVARNRGVSEATGELVSFLDADDLWLPGKLEAQVNALRQVKSGEAAVVTGVRRFAENKDVSRFFHETLFDCPLCESRQLRVLKVLSLNNGEMVVGANVLVSKSVFLRVGGWDETLTMAEDWDLLIRLSLESQVVSVPEPLVLYRKHESSVTSRFNNYIALEKQQRKMVKRYGQMANITRRDLRQVFLGHYLDFLGITRHAVSPSVRIGRILMLMRLAILEPSWLFTRHYLGHLKSTLIPGANTV